MKLLVTNNDGILAPGVEALVEVLQHFGEVYVICPEQKTTDSQSASAVQHPIQAKEWLSFPGTAGAWCMNATPAECVKLGIELLMEEKPDFVFSGIHAEPVIGKDVYSSGTIATAAEASLYDIPTAQISLNSRNAKVNYSRIKQLFYQVAEVILRHKTKSTGLLNINLPNVEKKQCQGIKVLPLDLSVSRYKFVGLNDAYGESYYWLKDQLSELSASVNTGEYGCLKDNYITISPIEIRTSLKKKQDQIERWFRTAQNQLT